MKFLFFFMGIPLMIMSFFETVDVLPYATEVGLVVDGNRIELSEEQQQNLEMQVEQLFENSRTMPAFAVTTQEMFEEELKDGTFVSLKFNGLFEVNGLPFDELMFRVDKEYHAFNLVRGLNGVFEGRCIYIDLDEKDMSEISDFISSINLQAVEGEEADALKETEPNLENETQNEQV